MLSAMLHDLVEAPGLERARHNLLDSGNVVETGDNRWENGVQFTQRGCYEISGVCATCDVDQVAADPQECIPYATFEPYLLDLGIVYATADNFDIKSLAKEDLDIGTSSRLEQMIWAGCVGGTSPTLSGGTSLGAAVSPKAALGAIIGEFQSAENHIGAAGTIHLSSRIAVELNELLVFGSDEKLYTRFGGHQAIVGNYPSTHIAGHLGHIDVYLGEVYVNDAQDEIKRANVQTFQVQRLALAAWNECATFVQAVTLA